MNKILDKLGIYDLVAVLLSGISVLTISLLVLQTVYHISIKIDLVVNETLSFFVISYFCGIVLQEIGSLISRKIIQKNSRLLVRAFSNSYASITPLEKKEIYFYVKSKLNLTEENDDVIYNYCKYYVFKNCDTTRIDKDQSLSAMSRSLSLYFLLLSVGVFCSLFWEFTFLRVILMIISVVFTVLFYNRFIRFTSMRYSSIFRTFYYDEQNSIQKWRKAQK